MQLTSARLERGLFRLHQFFLARNHLQATVTVLKRDYDAQLDTEKLLLRVESGPVIRVHVEGVRISRSKLKALLPVYRDGVLDEPSLAQSDRILEENFQEMGYFSAAAQATQEFHADSHVLDLTFRVNRGVRGQFMGYGVQGNRGVPSAQLMAMIARPASGLSRTPLYSRTLMGNKLSSLAAFYQSRGFLEVRVTARVDDRYLGQSGHRFVTFQVEEGTCTTVRNLVLTGIPKTMQTALWPSLSAKPASRIRPRGRPRTATRSPTTLPTSATPRPR